MPFEPGHQINLGRKYERGPVAESRKVLRSLALHVRERVDIERLIDKLVAMSEGKDPTTGEPISVRDQREAIKMLLERGYGMPALHVVVEGEVRNEVIAITPKAAREPMTLEQINAERARLRERGIKPKVIDIDDKPAALQLVEGEQDD